VAANAPPGKSPGPVDLATSNGKDATMGTDSTTGTQRGLDATAHDLHDLADLQRRVLREVQRSRPLAEMILAIQMAQGHIDAEQAWRFLTTGRNADAGRVECLALCRKAQRLLGKPPTAPAMPRFGTLAVLAGHVGIRTAAYRRWRRQRLAYQQAMADYCRRLCCCTPPAWCTGADLPRLDPLGDAAIPAGTAEGPGTLADGPVEDAGTRNQEPGTCLPDRQAGNREPGTRNQEPGMAGSPLVRLGPGGDYVNDIHLADGPGLQV
jgi:hypothetical protein